MVRFKIEFLPKIPMYQYYNKIIHPNEGRLKFQEYMTKEICKMFPSHTISAMYDKPRLMFYWLLDGGMNSFYMSWMVFGGRMFMRGIQYEKKQSDIIYTPIAKVEGDMFILLKNVINEYGILVSSDDVAIEMITIKHWKKVDILIDKYKKKGRNALLTRNPFNKLPKKS